jgi:hypothetical protein
LQQPTDPIIPRRLVIIVFWSLGFWSAVSGRFDQHFFSAQGRPALCKPPKD